MNYSACMYCFGIDRGGLFDLVRLLLQFCIPKISRRFWYFQPMSVEDMSVELKCQKLKILTYTPNQDP